MTRWLRTLRPFGLLPLSLALAAAAPASSAPEGAIQAGQQAYLARDYSGAERDFAQALLQRPDGDLEYDLGTAAAQAGDLGPAVLHLERALREAPWDADARTNLERIREKRLDKVVGQELGEAPVQRLLLGLPGPWLSWAFAALWALGFGLLIAGRRRRILAGFGIASLALALGAGGLAWAWERSEAVPYAVVIAKVAEVRPGPDPKLTPSFEVHEGLKVLLEKGEVGAPSTEERGLARIRLANGLEGWVEASALERI